MARHPRRAQTGQALVEYLLVITVIGLGCMVGVGYLRDSTATAYTRQQQALVAPTFGAINYVAPTATPTVTPTTALSANGSGGTGGNNNVTMGTATSTTVVTTATPIPTATVTPSNVRTATQLNSASTKSQETQYWLRVYNDALSPASGLKARIFLDLSEVYSAGYTASDVTTNKYWDQCGAAQLGAVTVWDAARRIYSVDVDWQGYSFGASSYCEVQFSIHLTGWQSVWNGQNDPATTGLNYGNYATASGIPIYRNGTRVYGNEP